MLYNKKNYLSGQNFAEFSDVFYAGNISKDTISLLDKQNVKIVTDNELFVTFKIKKLKLTNGDVIFCSSGHLEILFYYLRKLKIVNNITLISGQSDRPIDLKVFRKKPDCIKNWFSTNIIHEHPNLRPIPLGLANDYSPKNIRIENFLNYKRLDIKKEESLYINLQKNTNLNERSKLKNLFKNEEWVVYKEPTLSISEYMNDLDKYKFVLCPWGNGYDTHRLWETLYSGSIPVVKYHKTFENLRSLPIVFVKSYNDINLNFLNNYVQNIIEINMDSLDIDFWKNEISQQPSGNSTVEEEVNENFMFEFYYWTMYEFKRYVKSNSKRIRYYLNKILKRTLFFKKLF